MNRSSSPGSPSGVLWLWLLSISLLATAAVCFWPFVYHRTLICSVCAKAGHLYLRQVPMTSITWWTTSRPEEDTRLSEFLRSVGRDGSHMHVWQPVRGSGNGVQCGIGAAHAAYTNARSEFVVAFLDRIRTTGATETLDRWIGYLLDSETANFARGLLSEAFVAQSEEEWRTGLRRMEEAMSARFPIGGKS